MSHEAAKRCPFCKKIVAEEEKFCHFCELELPLEEPQQNSKEDHH